MPGAFRPFDQLSPMESHERTELAVRNLVPRDPGIKRFGFHMKQSGSFVDIKKLFWIIAH